VAFDAAAYITVFAMSINPEHVEDLDRRSADDGRFTG
jgi:hypothetical protein